MKKVLCILVCVMMIASLAACDSKTTYTNTETYNDITKTVTTTTVNGETTEEVVYTDKDGNVLDAAEGEAAFEAAKNETESASAEEETTETEETSEELYKAALNIVNDTDADINELYLVLASDDSWGSSILKEDDVFSAGNTISYDEGSFTYAPGDVFSMRIVTSAGDDISFDEVTIGNLDDPNTVTLTLTCEDGSYFVAVS